MNQITPPPKIEIIPSSAPFSEAQRSWLNGFFAGLLSDAPTPLSAEQGAAVMQGAGDGDDGEAPWHDQTMPIADRMKLAEGRPLRRRMMAAMAQQDCGQCGYNCNDYSDAIAVKSEARLNLCVPGGKETARMLKSLYEEIDKAPAAPSSTAISAAALRLRSSQSRDVRATIPRRRYSWAAICSTRANRKRKPGTSISICRAAVSIMSSAIPSASLPATISAMSTRSSRCSGRRIPPRFAARRLREVLLDDVSLAPAPDSLFELISYLTGGAQREKARALAQGEDPDGDAATLDVMAVLQKFPNVRPHPGSLHRGAGAVAAEALFDLVVAQCDARANCR